MRGIKPILVTAAVCLLLAGCMNAKELRQRTIIEAIGVDWADGEYRLTMQKLSPEAGVEGAQKKSTLVQTAGSTVSEALEQVAYYHGNLVFLGNSNDVIIGRTAAEQGLEQVLSSLNGNYQVMPEIHTVMAQDTAEAVLRCQAGEEGVTSAPIQELLEQGEKNGLIGRNSLREILSRYQGGQSEPYLPVVQVTGSGEEQRLQITGMAIFREGKLADVLDLSLAQGVLLATDELPHSMLTVAWGEDTASVRLTDSRTRLRTAITPQGVPRLTLDISCTVQVREVVSPGGGGAGPEDQEQIQRLVEEQLRNQVRRALDRVFVQDRCDVFRYGEFLRKQQPKWWKANEFAWEQWMPRVEFDLKVSCTIPRPSQEAWYRQGS